MREARARARYGSSDGRATRALKLRNLHPDLHSPAFGFATSLPSATCGAALCRSVGAPTITPATRATSRVRGNADNACLVSVGPAMPHTLCTKRASNDDPEYE